MNKTLLCLFALAVACNAANPVALIHGVSDYCTSDRMTNATNGFRNSELGVHVECIESGAKLDSWFSTMKEQEETACALLKANPNFAGKDIDLVALSQGGLIARGLINNCDFGGSIKKFISIGTPNMGIYTLPNCADGIFCDVVNSIVRLGIYTSIVQSLVGPTNYFKDSRSYKTYLDSSRYLADLNNEKSEKNATYKQKFAALDGVMLVMFTNDTVVNPKETAWFNYYDENLQLRDMTETQLYQEDYIGLKTLDVSGRLKRIELPGKHVVFTKADITEIFVPFLMN